MNAAQHTNPVPWTREEAASLKRQARYLLSDHGHPTSDRDPLTRENCGACRLNGYEPMTNDAGHVEPNYAGWARAFIQAGRPIPQAYRDAYTDALLEVEPDVDRSEWNTYALEHATPVGEPTRYALALARDVATFGETFA